jgi:hypothetical protein
MKSLDYSFSKREIGFILIIALLLMASGVFAWSVSRRTKLASITSFEECVAAGNPVMETFPEQCAADGNIYTKLTSVYTDPDGLFSLNYPTSLGVKSVEEGEDGDLVVVFGETADSESEDVLTIQQDTNGDFVDAIRKNWSDNNHTAENKEINGYKTEFVKVNFDGDAEDYIDDNYLIQNGDTALFINYREKYSNATIDKSYVSEHIEDFEDIIQSIKFNNQTSEQ